MGYAKHMLKDYENAIKAYRQALKLNPGSQECQFNLANVFLDSQDYENAIVHFYECLKIQSDNIQALMSLAKIFEKLE